MRVLLFFLSPRFSSNWVEGISGTVHEVGHALYEQGRPGGEAEDLPVSRALSMGVHESQVMYGQGDGGVFSVSFVCPNGVYRSRPVSSALSARFILSTS